MCMCSMHTVFLCTPFVKLPLYVCSAESPPSIRYMHHTFAPHFMLFHLVVVVGVMFAVISYHTSFSTPLVVVCGNRS